MLPLRQTWRHSRNYTKRDWASLRISAPQSSTVFSGATIRKYVTASKQLPHQRNRGIRIYYYAAALGVFGASFVTFTDYGQYVRGAVERSARVLYTLHRCIDDYRRTINRKNENDEQSYAKLLEACHTRCATRTLHAMEANGSIFIKLGQHLTSLNYLLPSEWCDTFIPLQDQCPKTSFKAVKRLIEVDTQLSFDDLFSEFEEEPLGAASLAQVHRAVDRTTGMQVAVKVQHPVLDYWAPLDLRLTALVFSTAKRAFPDYDLTWLSDEMQISLPQELDFVREGDNAMRTKEYFSYIKDCPLIIPAVLWAKRRVLVMEYLTGRRPDDLEYLDKNGISRDEVSASLARIFNTMIFSRGAPLHCDPHGGNIAVRYNPKRKRPHNFDIILYDHGLYRLIPRELQSNYARLWLAVLDADENGMRRYAYEVAGITDGDFELFASAITGREFGVVASDVSAQRTTEEKENITQSLSGGLLPQLVRLLGKLPRIILLILKTNDLTRSLDANLEPRQGPMRSFLILARYAAETVFEDQIDRLKESGSLFWPPRNALTLVIAWSRYNRIKLQLHAYEWWLFLRNLIGLENDMPGIDGLH